MAKSDNPYWSASLRTAEDIAERMVRQAVAAWAFPPRHGQPPSTYTAKGAVLHVSALGAIQRGHVRVMWSCTEAGRSFNVTHDAAVARIAAHIYDITA